MIRLKSKEDGSLSGILVHDRRVKSVEELHRLVFDLKRKVRDSDGPNTPLRAQFVAADELLFRHLAEAVVAASFSVNEYGKVVPLIENVAPTQALQQEEELVEYCE